MENKKRLNQLIIFSVAVLLITIIAVVVYIKTNPKQSTEVEGKEFNIVDEVKVSTNNITLNKGENKKFVITVSGGAGIIELASSNDGVTVTADSNDCNGTRCFYDALTGDASIEYTVTGKDTGSSQININLTDLLTSDEKPISGSGVINVSVK